MHFLMLSHLQALLPVQVPKSLSVFDIFIPPPFSSWLDLVILSSTFFGVETTFSTDLSIAIASLIFVSLKFLQRQQSHAAEPLPSQALLKTFLNF